MSAEKSARRKYHVTLQMCDKVVLHLQACLERGHVVSPVLFSALDCGGERFPPEGEIVRRSTSFTPTTGGWPRWAVKSMIIPDGVTVKFTSKGLTPGSFEFRGPRVLQDVFGDILMSTATWNTLQGEDMRGKAVGKMQPYAPGARLDELSFTELVRVDFLADEQWSDVILKSCRGQYPLRIGGLVVNRFRPSSHTCARLLESIGETPPRVSETDVEVYEPGTDTKYHWLLVFLPLLVLLLVGIGIFARAIWK